MIRSALDSLAAPALPARIAWPVAEGDTAGDTALAAAMARGHLAARRGAGGALVPGPAFRFAGLRIHGPAGVALPRLDLPDPSGRPATRDRVEALADMVRAHCQDQGFPFAAMDLGLEPGPGPATVYLDLDLHPGEGYKYGGFKYAGTRTDPEVLDRMLPLRPGEAYSARRVEEARRKLARSGYFSAVEAGPLFRDSTRNLLYPGLRLEDARGNSLGGIFGYDSERKRSEALTGFLDVTLANIRGTARDLDFHMRFQGGRRSLDFAYTEPWLYLLPMGAGAELKVDQQDSTYGEIDYGASVFQDMGFRGRYRLSFARQGNYQLLADGTRSTSSAGITGIEVTGDGRDAAPFTRRGYLADARLNAVRRDQGDSARYLAQALGRAGLWFGLAPRWLVHLAASGATDLPLDKGANRGDLFQVGGANSLRGYREREFLTDAYGYADLELQFEPGPRNRFLLFASPGAINRLDRPGPPAGLRPLPVCGYGAGTELGSKDWAFGLSYALNPDRGFRDGLIHISLENRF